MRINYVAPEKPRLAAWTSETKVRQRVNGTVMRGAGWCFSSVEGSLIGKWYNTSAELASIYVVGGPSGSG